MHRGLLVTLPVVECHQPAQFANIFKDQLLSLFEDKPKAAPTATTNIVPIPSTTGDDWADVGHTHDGGVAAAVVDKQKPAPAHQPAAVEFLPDPEAIPKPDALLRRTPYHMIILVYGASHIEIQCSHNPTLEVMAKYFKKWVKTDHNKTTKVSHNVRRFPFFFDYNLSSLLYMESMWWRLFL